MNKGGEKYNLVLYNIKVWITDGEHTEFIIPLVITSQSIQV